ncbi:hypothetical protein [Azospirillum thiophilum]|uniref:hypothetical protein n=1 Tax=Azospirillum thiophilum TaxID=528244 RepID=UPI00131466E5|nr:hypothetical protein [Azospirillum thiophilum]
MPSERAALPWGGPFRYAGMEKVRPASLPEKKALSVKKVLHSPAWHRYKPAHTTGHGKQPAPVTVWGIV